LLRKTNFGVGGQNSPIFKRIFSTSKRARASRFAFQFAFAFCVSRGGGGGGGGERIVFILIQRSRESRLSGLSTRLFVCLSVRLPVCFVCFRDPIGGCAALKKVRNGIDDDDEFSSMRLVRCKG
jgi:hypothetical protein